MSEFDHTANEIAVAVTTQLFRLLRNAQMHEISSLLTQGALDSGAEVLKEHAEGAGGFVAVMFADETVFVNGQPVRTQRSVYENILAVGEYLENADFNEITIRSSVTAEDIGKLLDLLVKQKKVHLPTSLSLQYVDPTKLLGEADGEQSITKQVAAVYGAATVLVRRFEDQLREDDRRLMRHVKRVCQRLVTLTRTGFPELLAIARRPATPTDEAAIAVNAAVIGALTGRALTENIHSLLRVTMAALQSEIGKPRVAGMYRADSFETPFVPALNQQMRKRLPASTAVMLLQAGRAAEQPMMRAVTAFEAAYLADSELLGWPYEGRIAPTVEAVIASVARRVARGMVEASGPDDLARMLEAQQLGKVERAALDIMFSVLGLLSTGTPVQMTDGSRGVVVSAGEDFASLERALIVRLLDSSRRPVEPKVAPAGRSFGWVDYVVTRQDDLLNDEYERYVASGGVQDEYELPSTTGVLSPDVGDHLVDRATLDFDSEAASSVVDSSVAAPWSRPRHQSGTSDGRPALGQPPHEREEAKEPATFRPEPGATDVPKQFQAPGEPKSAAFDVPKQFRGATSTADEASLPKQFRSADDKKREAGSKPEPKGGVPGAWIRPSKKNDDPNAEKPADAESEENDDSSDDGDFDPDALDNIVLFD